MPDAKNPAPDTLAAAKVVLIEAARSIDPLAALRTHPFTVVGVAATIGAVLGLRRRRATGSGSLMKAIAPVFRILAFALGRYGAVTARPAADATRAV